MSPPHHELGPEEEQEQQEQQPLADFVTALRSLLPTLPHQERLLAMLQTVDERLSVAGVPYWITGGTLLGACRHQGLIPHDDDIDIEIFARDLERAKEALGAVGRSYRGLGLWPGSDVPAGRFFFWETSRDSRFTSSVDVFLREDDMALLDEFPSHDETFPLERVNFHNILVNAPCKAQSFLRRCYGPTCCQDVVVWSHGSKSRRQLRASLDIYNAAVAQLGYTPPAAASSSQESLAAVGLECSGELEGQMWSSLGWASPLPLTCDGTEKEDPMVLALLGLDCRSVALPTSLVEVLQAGFLEELRQQTGAFLELRLDAEDARCVHIVGETPEVCHCADLLHRWISEQIAICAAPAPERLLIEDAILAS
mmetsp:Transcript_5249/g.11698  ORF Transcript_5249/g.11698 Transcript_5249/m.11698 type:complete len:368 (-) Transcript_5249:12-1115(-)